MGNEQDIRKMGGLWSKTKITAITFLIGTLAISGLPPFAGFFSKDEILVHAFQHNKLMWVLAMLSSFMTAFYMFRLFFLVFKGQFRGTAEQEEKVLESPKSMTIPLLVLALLSVIGGFMGMPEIFHFPHALSNFLDPIFIYSKSVSEDFGAITVSHGVEWLLMGFSVLLAAAALLLSYVLYVRKGIIPKADIEMSGFQKVFYDKFYLDENYDRLFVKPIEKMSNFFGEVFDPKGIDGLIILLVKGIRFSSNAFGRLQTGTTGFYILLMTLAIAFILIFNLGDGILNYFSTFFKAITNG